MWCQPAAQRPRFDAVVAGLVAEHEHAGDERQAAILDHLLRVVVLHAERLKMEAGPALSDALERFFAVVERDHARTRSVAHYARASGISARRLGELLSERVGKSTKQVIDDRVVLECKRRLAHTDATVKELADVLGFDEPTNLVKFFRRHTRTTPIAAAPPLVTAAAPITAKVVPSPVALTAQAQATSRPALVTTALAPVITVPAVIPASPLRIPSVLPVATAAPASAPPASVTEGPALVPAVIAPSPVRIIAGVVTAAPADAPLASIIASPAPTSGATVAAAVPAPPAQVIATPVRLSAPRALVAPRRARVTAPPPPRPLTSSPAPVTAAPLVVAAPSPPVEDRSIHESQTQWSASDEAFFGAGDALELAVREERYDDFSDLDHGAPVRPGLLSRLFGRR